MLYASIPLDFSKCKLQVLYSLYTKIIILNLYHKSSICKVFYTQEIYKVKASTTTNFMCTLQTM